MRGLESHKAVVALLVAVVGGAPVAVATHNSIGAHVVVLFPDEIGTGGELLPDVGPALLPSYHNNLATPRPAPPDQAGLRYNTDCAPASTSNNCYVGYLDGQYEYILYWTNYAVKRTNDRYPVGHGFVTTAANIPSYTLNPDASDSYCRGKQVNERLSDAKCNGDGHPLYYLGQTMVDVNLLETPFDRAQVALGNDVGSGSQVWPLLIVPYVYIFGAHHPSTPAATPGYALHAGAPPFSEVPSDACAGRTSDLNGDGNADCFLLTEADIRNHDTRRPTASLTDPRARVCSFRPQFTTINPSARNAGLCGFSGAVVNQFMGDERAGGYGLSGVSTFVNTKPGWYQGSTLLTHVFLGSGDGRGVGLQQFWAVNPLVPEQTDALWCIVPNIYTGGDLIHGTYQVDAVDTDLFRSPFAAQEQVAFDLTDPVVEDVNNLAGVLVATVNGVLAGVPPLPPEVQGPLDIATTLAAESQDRADYTERVDPEPDQLGDSMGTYDAPQFSVDRPALPLSCNAAGVLVQSGAVSLPGILRFNAVISQTAESTTIPLVATVNTPHYLKDPTITEGGLPARESATSRGYWHTDHNSFGGAVVAVYDSNEDGDFDTCRTESANAQPAADLCPWKALWDAYNPAATTFNGPSVGTLLDGKNYDLLRGVGLYFVMKVTGPVLLVNEDPQDNNNLGVGGTRTQAVGLTNPLATNCIVGTSLEFSTKPAFLRGEPNAAARVAQLCAGTNGDKVLVEDAFDDGIGDAAGTLSAAFTWSRALSAPRAGSGMLGSVNDALCITGAWSVKLNTVASDTVGDPAVPGDSLELAGGPSGTTHYFTDCDKFTSEP